MINIIPKKLYTRNKEKLLDRFLENWQKVAKNSPIWHFSDLSDLEKLSLEQFNHIHLLTFHYYPPWKASGINREKVIRQFLRKLPLSKKGAKLDISYLEKWPLGWLNQIHIFTVHWYLPRKAVHQKQKKLSHRFWEISLSSEKLTPTDDDGRRRTNWHWKSSAAFRLATIKIEWFKSSDLNQTTLASGLDSMVALIGQVEK